MLIVLCFALGLATGLFNVSVARADMNIPTGTTPVLDVRDYPHRATPYPITVRLWPRSQWDNQKHYRAARIVATRAVRVCTHLNDQGECAAERDAWTTAVARDPAYVNPVVASERRHAMPHPHLFEVFRTYDNLTYEELPHGPEAPPLERQDSELLQMARDVAIRSPKKMVLRWDLGHLWSVDPAYWNAGERALHMGVGLETQWQTVSASDLDDRPLYIPSGL